MFSVLVVDDEYLVRTGIRQTIDWGQYDIEIIGEAGDGEEGLEFALQNQPDIIITDIRMPFMDGLQFIGRLRENGIKSEIIVLSGYNEFDYVRTAMHNGAVAYLLKPIENEQLIQTVTKVTGEITQKRQTQAYYEKLERELPSIKKQFFHDLIRGTLTDEQDIREKMVLLDMQTAVQDYFVIVIKVEEYDSVIKCHKEGYGEEFKNTVLGLVSSLLSDNEFFFEEVKEHSVDECIIILHPRQHQIDVLSILKEECRQLLNQMMKEYDTTVSIGISQLCGTFADFNLRYAEACTAAGFKSMQGNRVHYILDEKGSNYRREISQAMEYIRNHYSENISAEMVARKLYISASHLMHLFKKELNKTFNECLMDHRVEEAKKLLKDPQFKIYQVSQMVGYKDSKYFNQIFKKATGINPGEYAKR